ncbi:MAG: hypothetical protein KAY24_08175 [Candidatus Eisenbacteria sp.]|nr:hypothetical protein [Candidatus Eisenbacteria bacterium]
MFPHQPQSLGYRTNSILMILALLIPLIGIFGNPAQADILFWPARLDFAVGDEPQHVAIADLNGDEVTDLAVASYDSDEVAVLLGAGDYAGCDGGGSTLTISGFALAAPNPMGMLTTIRFDLPHVGRTKLWIVDACGRLVEPLLDQTLAAGPHCVVWNASQGGGRHTGARVGII